MRDTVGAGALALVEETIAAGASPQAARKWWLSELARRANEQGVELSALPITPDDVARIQALVDEGAINDKLARQVFDGVLAGEGTPDEVVAARGLAIVSDEGALGDAVDRAIEANPDVAAEDPRRQGGRRRRADRRGDEGDARPGRRRPGPRADPRAPAVVRNGAGLVAPGVRGNIRVALQRPDVQRKGPTSCAARVHALSPGWLPPRSWPCSDRRAPSA